MRRVCRFTLRRNRAAAGLQNQLSHLCVARSRRGQQVAHRPRSVQVNATRPDAQRLQSATCRKQPGARCCRRAAGGRCVTICSFFPSYFRPSFSPPSLSRDHRPVRTVRKSLGTSRARLAMASQPILTRNFQAHRILTRVSEGVGAASRTR